GPSGEAGAGVTKTPWFGGVGTSYGAPIWAGLIAIANEARAVELPSRGPLNLLDPTLPMLYQSPGDFNDITHDGNKMGSSGVGYDAVTGLGTPLVPQVIADLAQPFNHYFSQVEGN